MSECSTSELRPALSSSEYSLAVSRVTGVIFVLSWSRLGYLGSDIYQDHD